MFYEIQSTFQKIPEYFSETDFPKTQYLCVGKGTTDFVLENNERIKKCNSLGINFNEGETDDVEIKSRINKAKQIIDHWMGFYGVQKLEKKGRK